MTVKELKEQLDKYDDDCDVLLFSTGIGEEDYLIIQRTSGDLAGYAGDIAIEKSETRYGG